MPISLPGTGGNGAAEEFDFQGYEFMGRIESGGYVYYGYKKYGGPDWKVARKDESDESAWQFAYGTDAWPAAWTDPTALSYGDPPDA